MNSWHALAWMARNLIVEVNSEDVTLVEDALVQHVLPSRYGGALPNLW